MAAMTDSALVALIAQLVKDCEAYRDQIAEDRIKAMEYYDGKMRDVPVDDDRSKVVSKDVRGAIKKVLPSVVRIILGSDKVVEYQPVGEQDEGKAEQATDYVNYVVFPESNGYQAVEDSINDALKLRNGIIRWWSDKKLCTTVSSHTGLDQASLVQLISDDEVEVLEQNQYTQQIDGPQGPVEEPAFDVKIRRRETKRRTRLACVAPENFLIHPDALDVEESPLTGINIRLRRSDLVAMGYDRDKIENLPIASEAWEQETEEFTRRRDLLKQDELTQRAIQEVEYYELYARVDYDDDGIAELRRIVFAGGVGINNLLENEEWDDVPFADIVSERRPHQREGNSITDDMMEIQKIKTVLLRQTLDNLYWQNMPQPIVQEGSIVNPEAVMNPKFGLPIRVSSGGDVRTALGYNNVPFVAKDSFSMLEYMDQEATDRTGISDASSGMAPDTLQNMTATATALIEQSGIGQTELMVRTIAQGLKRVFNGLLKMEIKYQDKPRTVRLRDKWVTFDPRDWNAEMDATVNTGLGAGTRERDTMMVQQVLNLQNQLLAGFGAVDNPFVTADNLYNSLSKMVEAIGGKSPELYFTKPSPEQVQALTDAAKNKPDPEMQKAQMQNQAAQQKAASDFQLEQMKLASEERIQAQRIQSEGALKKYQIDGEFQLKRQQNAAQVLTQEPVTHTQYGGQAG